MASSTQCFSESFSAYRASVVPYALYSLMMCIASMAISFFAALCLGVFGIVSMGSVASVLASNGSVGIGAVGVGVSLIALAVGLLAVLWVSSGLQGAYFGILNGMISKRAHSLAGFFMMIPKHATNIMLISIICSVLIAAPVGIAILLSPLLGSLLSLAAFALVVVYAVIAAFLLVFAVPAAVIDGKGPLSAIKASVVMCSRNVLQVFLYFVIACALAIPAIVPLFNMLYVPLFYMPLVSSALLRLYRTAQ